MVDEDVLVDVPSCGTDDEFSVLDSSFLSFGNSSPETMAVAVEVEELDDDD